MKHRKALLRKNKEKEQTYHEIDLDLTQDPKFNTINTQKYTLLNLIPKTFLEFVLSPVHLWFVFLLCVSFTPYVHPISFKLSISASLIFLFLFKLHRNFQLGKLQSEHDAKLNKSQVAIFTGVDFVMGTSEEVREGDLILLKASDQCPADSLILAADSENNEVFVDIRKVNGETNYIRKRTLKETQSFVVYDGMGIAELKKHLDYVKVIIPNEKFQQVGAKVKIKGSPRVLVAGYEDFLMRGSYIVDCGWVLALVVYVGNDCKALFNLNENHLKISKFSDYLTYILGGNCVLLVFYVLFTVLLGIFYKGLFFSDSSISLVFNTIMIFGNLVPVTLYLGLELYSSIKLRIINKKNPSFYINNEKILKDLGLVEYILTEKSNVLTQGETKVQACLVSQRLYLERIPKELHSDRIDSDLDSPRSCSKNILESPQFTFDVLKNDLASQTCSKEPWLLAVSLQICNSFMENNLNECVSDDQQSLKDFSNQLGLRLVSKNGQVIEIEYQSNRFNYSVISCSEQQETSVFKALIKDHSTGEAILVYRGSLPEISPFLEDEDDSNYLLQISTQFPFKFLKKIVFGFKVLKKEELKLFMVDYKQTQSAVNKRQRIVEVFENHSQDLRFLGLIGLEKEVPKANKKAVKEIIEASIKVWITTREDEESTLASGYSLGIINGEMSEIKLINLNDKHEVLTELKSILKNDFFSSDLVDSILTKNANQQPHFRRNRKIDPNPLARRNSSLHSMLSSFGFGTDNEKGLNKIDPHSMNFFLVIDGKTLDLAVKSRKLLKYLTVVLFAAKAVLACGLCPEQKRLLVKIVKENLKFKPVVLTVGEKHGNRKMISEASIGVQVSENFNKNAYLVDAFITSFSVLPELILRNGGDCYNGYRVLIFISTYQEVVVCTAFFLYQSLCRYSGCYLVDPDLYVVFEFCISLLFLVLVSLFCVFPKDWRAYQNYQLNVMREGRNFFKSLLLVFYSIFQGALLYFFAVFGLSCVVNSAGFTEDFETLGVVFFILFVLFIYIQGIVVPYVKTRSLFSAFVSFTVFVIVLSATVNANFASSYLSTSSFAKRSTVWTLICLFPLFILLISGAYIEYLKTVIPKLSSRLSQFQSKLTGVYCDSFSFKFSKEEDFKLDDFTLEFKHPYRELMYREMITKSSAKLLRIFLSIVSLISIINTILVTNSERGFLNTRIYSIIPTISQILLALASFATTKYLATLKYLSLVSILIFCLTESFLNTLSFTTGRYPLLFVIFSLSLYSSWKQTLISSFLIYCTSLASVLYEIYIISYKDQAILSFIWIIVVFFIAELMLIYNYLQTKNRKIQYMLSQKTEIELEKSANILNYLLPEFVRKRVKDGVRYIAEDKGTVSVIFCDICEFDKIMNIYSPIELTSLIDNIFGRIDLICEAFGITKIETVGKTYLACTGLKDSEKEIDPKILKISHARRAIEMGLEVIRESTKIRLKDGSFLMFKIGINSGPVTAGVVGFHKPQFSLVGDTVNTASRMASTLTEPNSIQISLATFDLIDDARGLVFKDCKRDIKGKGFMDTKIVEIPVQAIEEIVTDDVSSIFNRRRSSVLMLNSTPTCGLNAGRSSETPLKTASRGGRSSLLFNLDVRSPSELIQKINTRKVFKFFYHLLRETEEEKQFRINNSESIQVMQKIGLVSSGICNGLVLSVELVFFLISARISSLFRLVIFIVSEVFVIGLIVSLKKTKNQLKYSYFNSCLYSVTFIMFYIENNVITQNVFIEFTYFSYLFLLLNFYSGAFFKRNLLFNLPIIALWLLEVFRSSFSFSTAVQVILFIAAVLTFVLLNEKKIRLNAVLKSAAEKELEKTQQLLSQMMPPHALAKLEEGQEVTDRLSKVTLMYADIVGFTAWSSLRTPREVVGMLSELFTRFDKMCIENNVYKVHTIGDCYVAIGYVDIKNRNPAKEAVNLINFAISLIKLIEETNEKCKIELGMRIGVHTGDIIGGITGTKIVRYDIYGYDVLVANKMESNGKAGKITVSESTKEIIEAYAPGLFEFVEKEEIQVSDIGETIKMYFTEKAGGDRI